MDFLFATNIHFTGLKGVGMTALALCAQDLGIKVTGSDLDKPFVTDAILKSRRLKAKIGFSPDHISPKTDLLVYTAAHQGSNNLEVKTARQKGIATLSHAQALGQAMAGKTGISVCGVGGKTTTSAMLATILDRTGAHPSFCIGVGSISSLKTPGRYDKKGRYFVAEADEYATDPASNPTPRFMYQTPQIIICTNIEFDHPDVYQSLEQTKAAFLRFFNRLPPSGLLIINTDSPTNQELIRQLTVPYQTYGISPQADWRLDPPQISRQTNRFLLHHQGMSHSIKLQVPGQFNAQNAAAALAAAVFLGLDIKKAASALKDFTGTQRRFEPITTIKGNIQLYDDYAHHPKEIKATLKAARTWFPGHQIIAIFQPHTYSRTKALFSSFASSFALADKTIFLPIYASARETADPAVSSQKLSQATTNSFFAQTTPDLLQYIKDNLAPPAVILTLGAGDIFLLHDQIIASLTS